MRDTKYYVKNICTYTHTEVLVATPPSCKYGQYSFRGDFLLVWPMSVDELKQKKKLRTHSRGIINEAGSEAY